MGGFWGVAVRHLGRAIKVCSVGLRRRRSAFPAEQVNFGGRAMRTPPNEQDRRSRASLDLHPGRAPAAFTPRQLLAGQPQ
jgi:hypothetical protein